MKRAALVLLILTLAGCSSGTGGGSEDRVYLHRVQTDETMADIAAEYYGDPQRAHVIARFNGVEEKNIEPGKMLRIPMSSEDVARLKTREQAREPYNRGISLAEQGSYLDAVQQFRAAIDLDPDFADAHYNMAVTYQKLGSHDKALEELREVVRLRPDVAQYRYALGNSLFHLERYGEAAGAFEEALELDPTHAKSTYSLAVCFEKMQKTKQAMAMWRRYLELDGSSVWADEARRRLEALENG